MPRIPRRTRRNPRKPRGDLSRHTPKFIVVRGPASQPVRMALESSRTQAEKMARFLRSHFPTARVRVMKYREAEAS